MRNLDRFILLLFISCLLIFSRNNLHAQQPNFQIVKGLPTNEVYDLLIDSKGLLWIAHDQGLSRYDGKTFKHFTNPEQSGRGISGLIEDKYGRVWCYNFNAQIFWVKNDVMHLLREYNLITGYFFPKIAIVGDKLIATTTKGFFEYDLITGRSQEQKMPVFFDNVMTVVNNKVIMLLRNDWALYEGKGQLKFLNIEKRVMHNEDAQLLLQQVVGDLQIYTTDGVKIIFTIPIS